MKSEKRTVFGIGINDAGYITRKHAAISGKRKEVWRCPLYDTWRGMMKRCYSSNLHARQPTYIGCTVDAQWHRFSAFREWMVGQEWEGMEIDKDILSPGNKVYGPDFCVLVPCTLNLFLIDRAASRGDLPIGVSILASGRYRAMCSNPFTKKNEYLGLFRTPDGAHSAWRKRKHELACQWADMQADPRIAKALRDRFA